MGLRSACRSDISSGCAIRPGTLWTGIEVPSRSTEDEEIETGIHRNAGRRLHEWGSAPEQDYEDEHHDGR